jgi:hypothetical protein
VAIIPSDSSRVNDSFIMIVFVPLYLGGVICVVGDRAKKVLEPIGSLHYFSFPAIIPGITLRVGRTEGGDVV